MFERYKSKNIRKLFPYLMGSSLAFYKYHKSRWSTSVRESNKQFIGQCPDLSHTQLSIVKNLKACGIAFSSLQDLFEESDKLSELLEYERKNAKYYRKSKSKLFLKYMIGGDLDNHQETYEHDNPFYKLALSDVVLNIVNSYFNGWSRFIYQELNHTRKAQEELSESQRWHRDPGMHGYLKMFIYLNDVDVTSGPFEYVPCTHIYGVDKKFPQKYFGQRGYYPPEGAVEERYEESQLLKCLGPRGTVVFADTTGLHRGGNFSTGYRILSTSGFCQPNDRYDRLFDIDDESTGVILKMSSEAQFALNLNT